MSRAIKGTVPNIDIYPVTQKDKYVPIKVGSQAIGFIEGVTPLKDDVVDTTLINFVLFGDHVTFETDEFGELVSIDLYDDSAEFEEFLKKL